tara:strand:- start:2975 stop:4285 length:1311 start_codon:yes stop_codon:yes gene_type:complete
MYTNIYELDLNNDYNDSEKFINKKYTFNNNEYNIIKYNKETLNKYKDNEDYFNTLSKYRSVITKNDKLICYSPAKSINYDKFIQKYNIHNSWVEDFIDGTMINVFYDVVNETWEIATKSTVGGNILFFNDFKTYNYLNITNTNDNNNSNKVNYTFRSMFFEACNLNNFDLNTLDRKYTYTFILQHPFNRIVTPISIPTIYLIKIYEIINKIDEKKAIIKELNLQNFISSVPYIFLNTGVKFINKYPISDNFDSVKNYYTSKEIPYYCVGCMIYNEDGTRSKLRNDNYENVRKLRGNQPKLQYNYLCLKQENKIKEFLYYYPEHTFIFNKFKLKVFEYTNQLFMNYISCFIRKEKVLKEYDFQFKNHMYKLHEKYKTELKPNNKNIDKKFVIDYFNNLHPSQQMFVINYTNDSSLQKVNNEKTQDVIMNNESFVIVN